MLRNLATVPTFSSFLDSKEMKVYSKKFSSKQGGVISIVETPYKVCSTQGPVIGENLQGINTFQISHIKNSFWKSLRINSDVVSFGSIFKLLVHCEVLCLKLLTPRVMLII